MLQREILGATRERMLREIGDALEAITSASPILLVLRIYSWWTTPRSTRLSRIRFGKLRSRAKASVDGAKRDEPADGHSRLVLAHASPIESYRTVAGEGGFAAGSNRGGEVSRSHSCDRGAHLAGGSLHDFTSRALFTISWASLSRAHF